MAEEILPHIQSQFQKDFRVEVEKYKLAKSQIINLFRGNVPKNYDRRKHVKCYLPFHGKDSTRLDGEQGVLPTSSEETTRCYEKKTVLFLEKWQFVVFS